MTSDSVPGCFNLFKRNRASTTTHRSALLPVSEKWPLGASASDESTPTSMTAPPVSAPCACANSHAAERVVPAKHEHYEVCGCAETNGMAQAMAALGVDAGREDLPAYDDKAGGVWEMSDEVREVIRISIESYTDKLTKLSLFISDHPEEGFKEFKAHDKLTAFLEEEGFGVERHFAGLETAFRAHYTHGDGGRTFAFNSEYDALPGIGHACGHNLIAIAGVAATLGMRAAMKKCNIEGTVILIGTPAEEGGIGKQILLDNGGYKCVDACMMIHPVGIAGIEGIGAIVPTLAIAEIDVEYFGRVSHAGGAPWDGINALDAVNIAYTSVSALRQQMHPTDRAHGIVTHGGDAPNIIPGYTAMRWYVRAQSAKGVDALVQKILACFDAAATATGCKVKHKVSGLMYDLRNCVPLADEFAHVMNDQYRLPTTVAVHDWSSAGGSTDFGNVTYAMPACHPHYAVPSTPGRSNHTVEFRNACRTTEAHAYTLKFAAGMSATGARFLSDKAYAKKAVDAWKKDMATGGKFVDKSGVPGMCQV